MTLHLRGDMRSLLLLRTSKPYNNNLSSTADDRDVSVNWSYCCRAGDGSDVRRQTAPASDQRRAGLCAATAAC